VGDLLQRSGLLYISDEESYHDTRSYDGDREADDPVDWLALTILFPNGDQRQSKQSYAEIYD
jgi:hypothetical protein